MQWLYDVNILEVSELTRNWNLKYDSKALVNVVTSFISLCPQNSTQLQRNPSLSPMQWLYDVNMGEVCVFIQS